jgi:membrane protein YdbS with pleckstrin-like domain
MNNKLAQNSAATSTTSWPIASILTIVFVVIKLTETIDWSWWFVLSPLWISAAFTVFILLVIFIALVMYEMFKR